jgi:general secretion pathway protein H
VVALAIIAVLFGAVATSVGAITGSRAKAAAGELGGVIRSLYDTAALKGRTCRLAFQLPAKGEDGSVRYWAECAEGHVTTSRDRDQALEDANHAAELAAREERSGGGRRTASRTSEGPATLEEQAAQEQARVAKLSRFSQYTAEEIAPRELSGVKISLWTQHQRDPVTSGLAYLYFFPQGYTEKAYVYFEQGDNVWTITVAPLTGKTTIVARKLEVPRS